MKKTKEAILAAVVLVLGSGCATITRGSSEAFVIETDPAGAEARLSTGLQCRTPCSLKVKRRGDFVVTLEKDGYETVQATVTSSIDNAGSAGMAGNVLVGGNHRSGASTPVRAPCTHTSRTLSW